MKYGSSLEFYFIFYLLFECIHNLCRYIESKAQNSTSAKENDVCTDISFLPWAPSDSSI